MWEFFFVGKCSKDPIRKEYIWYNSTWVSFRKKEKIF
ncbi:hypothetical protein J2W95_001105 [Flavobacterium granuli]|uniref:Uncharacterized protein n=1 Tax=Flavobacterium granuli TaxID=280093 RepID=A0ABU1S2M4_9FLAO|nr:hypothetical protein [Flavobacterium granuli]